MEQYLRILGVAAGLLISVAVKAHPHEVPAEQRPPRSHKWVQQQIQKKGEKAERKLDPVKLETWHDFR